MSLEEKYNILNNLSILNEITTLDLHLMNLGFELQSAINDNRLFVKNKTIYKTETLGINTRVDMLNPDVIDVYVSYNYNQNKKNIYSSTCSIQINHYKIRKDIPTMDYDEAYIKITEYLRIMLKEIDNLFKED